LSRSGVVIVRYLVVIDEIHTLGGRNRETFNNFVLFLF